MTKASPAKCAEKPSDPTRGPPFFYGAKGNWRSSPKKLREMDMVEKVNITWWAHIVIFKDQQSGHERTRRERNWG